MHGLCKLSSLQANFSKPLGLFSGVVDSVYSASTNFKDDPPDLEGNFLVASADLA